MSSTIPLPSRYATAGWGSSRTRGWMIVAVAGALIGVGLIVAEVARLASDPDGSVTALAVTIVAVAVAVTVWCYTYWSRRVRFLLELLEETSPGSSTWKALGYPMNADTLREFAEGPRFISNPAQTRTGLYAVFADDALTLWRRRGNALESIALIPRDCIRFEGWDWRRPIFSFSVASAMGQLPFALALSRGRFRGGVRDTDAAHTVAAHWCRG